MECLSEQERIMTPQTREYEHILSAFKTLGTE